jgi:sugar-specific transcriptional regulator TrmB
MVILFRPEGNKFIASDSNQLFYLLGISGIISMILSLVNECKKRIYGTITKKQSSHMRMRKSYC